MCSNTIGIKIACFILVFAFIAINCSDNGTEPEPIPNVAIINLNDTQQIIKGFGGVNMPGWIEDMTPDQVNKAFGADSGQIGMTILRIRVPFDSTKFNLEVPTAQLAKSLVAIIIASPWTPPAWMKSNNNIVGGRLNDISYPAYAAHLKSFADYMSNNNAPLYAISLQNEPDVRVDYESCDWNASEMVKFIRENAPSIGIKIIAPESYNFNHTISDAILNDPVAASHVSIIGGHIYGGGLAPYPLAINKGKEVWMTEHLVLDTDWHGALATALEINDCMNAGMSAYLWYIRRFYGPIDDNSNVTKRGYVMSQYARFIRPGFTRVSATDNPQTDVYLSAYKSGTKVVIVAINYSSPSIEQTFMIQNGTVTNFIRYVTSSTKNCAQDGDITISNGNFTATLDGKSVTTFVSK
jgi:glucuronoarabinoxylan endo-1,4-beta-xylanase